MFALGIERTTPERDHPKQRSNLDSAHLISRLLGKNEESFYLKEIFFVHQGDFVFKRDYCHG